MDVRPPFSLWFAHVQLPQLRVRLRHRPKLVVDELIASAKPRIPERNRHSLNAVEIGDRHLQVDNVLRRKSWHSRRSDVINANRSRTDKGAYAPGEMCEPGRPLRVVFTDNY